MPIREKEAQCMISKLAQNTKLKFYLASFLIIRLVKAVSFEMTLYVTYN